MEKHVPKFVYIAQLYGEAGVSFENIFPPEKAREWRLALDSALTPKGLMKEKHAGYKLGFIITSSAHIFALEVKGPRKGRKDKFLEYTVWIPYGSVISDKEPTKKLTDYFKRGVADVLQKLEYPGEEINKALKGIS